MFLLASRAIELKRHQIHLTVVFLRKIMFCKVMINSSLILGLKQGKEILKARV
jgi:hypothetical protein